MDETRLRALSLGGAVAVTAVLAIALAVLAAFFGTANAVFILFVALMVTVMTYEGIYGYFEDESADREDERAVPEDEPADALETLRERYARDEISEADFERKLEALLETGTVADVERHVRENTESADAREIEHSFE